MPANPPKTYPTLRTLLENSSLDQLKAIASHLGLNEGLISRARLMETLPSTLANINFLVKLLDKLPPQCQAWLLILTLLEDGGQTTEGILPKIPKGYLRDLLNFGLLYQLEQGFWGGLYVPREILVGLKKYFSPKFPSFTESQKQAVGIKGGELAMLHDIFTTLFLAHKGQLRITKQGKLFRRSTLSIVELFEVKPSKPPLPLEEEGERLEFIINYLLHRNVVGIAAGSIRPYAKAEREWHRQGVGDRCAQVLAYWEGNERRGKVGYYLTKTLLSRLRKEKVYSYAEFSETFGRLAKATEELDPLPKALHPDLEYLCAFGLVELGFSERGEPVTLTLTTLGDALLKGYQGGYKPVEDNHLTVQANYTVLVSKNVGLDLRRKLELFADLDKCDQMLHYKLDKNTVYRALIERMSEEDMLTILRTYSANTLPQNIAYSISQWASSFGKLSFYSGLFMVARDDELCEEISALPNVKPFIKEKIMDRILALDLENYQQVYQTLLNDGYLPQPLTDSSLMIKAHQMPMILPINRLENPNCNQQIIMALEFAIQSELKVKLTYSDRQRETRDEEVVPIKVSGMANKTVLKFRLGEQKGTQTVPISRIQVLAL
jgi:hypothetical protein